MSSRREIAAYEQLLNSDVWRECKAMMEEVALKTLTKVNEPEESYRVACFVRSLRGMDEAIRQVVKREDAEEQVEAFQEAID